MTGNAAIIAKESGDPAEGAFQLYCVLREYLICPTPNNVSDEQAAVLGLAFGTAAFGLFSKDYLGLDMPTVPARKNPKSGHKLKRAVIITGGASSLGACAVQLAVSAGYEVVSTCSPKNFALVKGLGASHVFDYNSHKLVPDIVRALRDRELCGALTVGAGADQVCVHVMRERFSKTPELPTRKFVALAGGARRDPNTMNGMLFIPGLIYTMTAMMTRLAVKKMITGYEVKFVLIKDVATPDSCVARVYTDFLGPALATGQFQPAPDAMVIGRGLDKIQEALEVQKKGVSGKKVVVSLP